jgi:hypothetical protein
MLKILYGLFFRDLKQAVYSITFSFYAFFKKLHSPLRSDWESQSYENSATGKIGICKHAAPQIDEISNC